MSTGRTIRRLAGGRAPAGSGSVRRARAWLPRALVAAVLLLVARPAAAQVQFPNAGTYHSIVRSSDWSPVRDYTGDENPDNNDLSSHGSYANKTIGDMDSVSMAWDSASQVIYFRWLLSGLPLTSSQGEVNNNTSCVVLIDSNGDNVSDYSVNVSKTNAVTIYQGATLIKTQPVGTITRSGTSPQYVWTDGNGCIQVTDTGLTTVDAKNSSHEMYYLEVRVPLSWMAGISANTFIRPFFGTSGNDNNINKDYMLGSSTDFTAVPPTTVSDPSRYGALYESRDLNPSSAQGTWSPGETVQLSGYGWPANSTLPVRIYSPDGTLVYQGTVTTDATGAFSLANTWTIPGDASTGTYTIQVAYPPSYSTYSLYDTFTCAFTGSHLSATKGAPATANSGSNLDYTITLKSNGTQAATSVVVDDPIPTGAFYRVGTASAAGHTISYKIGGSYTTTPPVDQATANTVTALRFTATGSIAAGATSTLSYGVILSSSLTNGQAVTNTATITYKDPSNNAQTPVTAQATTTLANPLLTLSKSAPATAGPGANLDYTLAWSNIGTAAAQNVVVDDPLPTGEFYRVGSASAAGYTVSYQMSGGGYTTTPPADQATANTVTALRFTAAGNTAAGAAGTLSYGVILAANLAGGQSLTNTATASYQDLSGSAKPAVTGQAVTTVGVPTLGLVKSVVQTPARASATIGDALAYTVQYTNTGSLSAQSVILTDFLPAGVALKVGSVTSTAAATVSYSSDGGATWTYLPAANAQGEDPRVSALRWQLNAAVAAGATGSVGLETVVLSSMSAGSTALNTATAQYVDGAGQPRPQVSASVATPLALPGVTLSAGRATPGAPGAVVVFPHTVTNIGPAADTFNLTATSTKSWAMTLYHDVNGDGQLDAGDTLLADTNGDGVADTGAMAASGSLPILVRVYVPQEAMGTDCDTIKLTAASSLDSRQSDGQTDSVPLAPGPLLTLVKYIGSPGVTRSTAQPGASITYGIICTNAGSGIATNVVISDVLSPFLIYQAGSTQLNGATVTPDPYDASTRMITLQVGTLAPSATATVTLTAVVR